MPKKVSKPDEEWKKQLSPEQFLITREKGTEAPFSGRYHDSKEAGIYRCVCCGAELFGSATKFDSGTGIHNDTLTFASNDPDEPSIAIAMTGAGS